MQDDIEVFRNLDHRNKHTSLPTHRNRWARATLVDKGCGSLCQGGGVARVTVVLSTHLSSLDSMISVDFSSASLREIRHVP